MAGVVLLELLPRATPSSDDAEGTQDVVLVQEAWGEARGVVEQVLGRMRHVMPVIHAALHRCTPHHEKRAAVFMFISMERFCGALMRLRSRSGRTRPFRASIRRVCLSPCFRPPIVWCRCLESRRVASSLHDAKRQSSLSHSTEQLLSLAKDLIR